MRFCAFALLALVVIAAAQQDTSTNDNRENQYSQSNYDEEEFDLYLKEYNSICENLSGQKFTDCEKQLEYISQCYYYCVGNEIDFNMCYKNDCQTENEKIQAFFDKQLLTFNTEINMKEQESICGKLSGQQFTDCEKELKLITQCYQQCKQSNEQKDNEFIMCYKSDCQSENQQIKAYFDKLLPNTSTGIDTPSTSKDEKKIDLDQENINNTETPCQAGSEEAIKACQEELNKLENCLTQCTEQNKENTYEVIRCYKSNCKSENNDVQDYFEKKIASMNTGISILAFTVIVSVLSLLL
ncbi:transmembrane protein, putative (macronuclear) [Tetrahymena thermophila SB210]|uniref:Transmembrane protein, putative n=1 Tax=Tetrahymena thermophila (strain SB210) TaxID=312017 RepID=Q23VC7_TETTS|nr:transmembrane protein, putative [Tetrahymena thermophila SB210]EAS00509.1 transmembrane protein, putative [Tetrahymena thermophila SB210]|eukprot:XP_001020754.1 transmembrane protein, putative [Tetrahymena thermophila SB210]